MEPTQLLEILACPICHGKLEFIEKDGKAGFLCPKCAVVFPIMEDIPVMLPSAAVPVSEWPQETA